MEFNRTETTIFFYFDVSSLMTYNQRVYFYNSDYLA